MNNKGVYKMFKSKVVEIGELVKDFEEEKLLVLFGTQAPPELKDISVIHEPVSNDVTSLQEGTTLSLGNIEYTIQKVGSEALTNLEDLGHLSIYFSDDDKDILPGAILVKPGNFPNLKINDYIQSE